MKVNTQVEEKIDVVSTEAMIQEANITTNNARIINHHIQQYFGHFFLPLK
jgi:hypothetical protein